MRWLCLGFGVFALTTVGLLSAAPYRQIVPGMRLGEVEALMGEKGEPQGCMWSGDMDYWARNECFTHRWEDPYATIDVYFKGPMGAAEVESIDIHVWNPSYFTKLRPNRIILLLSVLLGFGFVLCGLWPWKPDDRLNSLPGESSTTFEPLPEHHGGQIMRWLCLAIGGVILTAVPLSQRLPHDHIVKGMKLGEVEALMGGSGKPHLTFVSGPPELWPDEFFARRWEDPYTTVYIHFEGRKGPASVVGINVEERNQPDFTKLCWSPRTIHLPLVLLGFGFVIYSLWPRNTPYA
jgi:hypothetical protein